MPRTPPRSARFGAARRLWSGSKVKVDGVIVWREGKESQSAAESYDHACGVMHQRRREAQDRRLANLTRFHRS